MTIMQEANVLATSLAARVRAEREERGRSIDQLAARSGVSRVMISKVEREAYGTVLLVIFAVLTGKPFVLDDRLIQQRGDFEHAEFVGHSVFGTNCVLIGARLAVSQARGRNRDPATGVSGPE